MTGLHYEPSVLVTCYEAPSKGPVAALLGKPGRGELLSAPRPYLFIDKAPASSYQSIPLPPPTGAFFPSRHYRIWQYLLLDLLTGALGIPTLGSVLVQSTRK